ncbi:MAG: ABC transporter ATP-binding protein/permease [Planctomycetes bacterium]|nr:ABC transporter ATP-binding protein/permease [Planctomycetota bacterium]
MGLTHTAFMEEDVKKGFDPRLARRFFAYVLRYKGLLWSATILLFFFRISAIAAPWITKVAVDRYMNHPELPLDERLAGIHWLVLAFLGVMFVKIVTNYAETLTTQMLGQRVMHDMRMSVFRHLQTLSLSFFSRNPVGRLMTRVTSDVSALNEMLTSGVVALAGDLVTLLAAIGIMLHYDWRLTLVSFAVVPPMMLGTRIFRRVSRQIYRITRAKIARLAAYLSENLAGMKVVQLFRRERENSRRFGEYGRDLYNTHLRATLYSAIFFPFVDVMRATAVALIFWYGGYRTHQGHVTLGTLIAFISLVELSFQPLRELAEKYNILQSAMAAAEKIFGILDEKPEVLDAAQTEALPDVKGDVSFESVSFAYDAGNDVLHDISFRAKPGEMVALVGPTGSGKTSIVNLLCRFWDVRQGSVLVDGHDVRKVAQRDLRKRIAIVLQDVFLFTGTVAENIAMGDRTMPRERIEAAARAVHADGFIRSLPGGYDARVSERGSTFSAGQRQLIAFARAMAADPRIIILDEATSNIDTETEILIQDAMRTLLAGRTSVVIAHRLSTIHRADRIVVLHHGKIVEQGKHADLVAAKGMYARLHELQFEEAEAAPAAK